MRRPWGRIMPTTRAGGVSRREGEDGPEEGRGQRGVAITARMLTVTGKMALINNAEKGLFFRVDGASIQ